MTISKENNDNKICLDKDVNSIMRHLIRACQGRDNNAVLHNELKWAQSMLNELVDKIDDKNAQIIYSEADREKLMANYKHSEIEMYL